MIMKSANAYSVLENGENYRNDNAEWAILKEKAGRGDERLSWNAEFQREEEERDKYRRRGKMLLEIINRIPDRLDTENKSEILDKIHKSANIAGISNDLDDALNRESHPSLDVESRVFGVDKPELSTEEELRVENLREKVFDMSNAEYGRLRDRFPSGIFCIMVVRLVKLERFFRLVVLKMVLQW